MMRSRSLLLLVGPLAIAASLSAPAEACWLFGGGCGWGAGRAAYRPVYGYGRTSFYAPYSSYGNGCNSCGYGGSSGYGGYAYGLGGCNSCSGGACGVSNYGGYGMSACCDTCGGQYGYGGTCSNCAGGDCQLGAPAGPVTPDPTAAQPQAPYSDMGTTSGESHPTTRNPPPDSDLGTPRTIPDDDEPRGTNPRPSFRPATPPAEGTTPVTPPANNNPTPPANDPDTEGTLGEPTSGAAKDGAGFLDELDSDIKFRAPVIKVDLDDKVAWKPTGTRTRMGTRPSYQTARLIRIAAYPAPAPWVPTYAEIAKK